MCHLNYFYQTYYHLHHLKFYRNNLIYFSNGFQLASPIWPNFFKFEIWAAPHPLDLTPSFKA